MLITLLRFLVAWQPIDRMEQRRSEIRRAASWWPARGRGQGLEHAQRISAEEHGYCIGAEIVVDGGQTTVACLLAD